MIGCFIKIVVITIKKVVLNINFKNEMFEQNEGKI